MALKYADIDNGNDSTGDGSSGNPWNDLPKLLSELSGGDIGVLAPSLTNDYTWSSFTVPTGGIKLESPTLPNLITGYGVRINAGGGSSMFSLGGNDFFAEKVVFKNNYNTTGSAAWYYGRLEGVNQTIQFTNCVLDNLRNNTSTAGRGGTIGNGPSVSVPNQMTIKIYIDDSYIINPQAVNPASNNGFIHTTGSQFDIKFRETLIYHSASANALQALVANYSSVANIPSLRNVNFVSANADNPAICTAYNGSANASNAVNSNLYGVDTTSVDQTDCIAVDPLFLDAANNDFRVDGQNSPLKNAGLKVI